MENNELLKRGEDLARHCENKGLPDLDGLSHAGGAVCAGA